MKRFVMASGVAALVVAAAALLIPPGSGATAAEGGSGQAKSSSPPLPLKVVKTQLVNSRNERVRLRGVNVASLEWSSDGEGHVLDTVKRRSATGGRYRPRGAGQGAYHNGRAMLLSAKLLEELAASR